MKRPVPCLVAACVALLIAAPAAPCHAQPGVAARPRAAVAADPRAAQVLAADDERIAAVTQGDEAALERILDDELRYVHSNGAVDSKESFIDLVVSGRTRYVSFETSERIVLFPSDDVAVVSGRADVVIEKEGNRNPLSLGFMAVWRRVAGEWRFAAWQSARLQAPPPGR